METKNNHTIYVESFDELPVSFETASIASCVGFNEKCKQEYDTLGNLQNCHYAYVTNSDIDNGCKCTAPKQSRLQKWLRDTHRLDVTVRPIFADDTRRYLVEILYVDTLGKKVYWKSLPTTYELIINHSFEVFEDAFEFGLYQGLRFLVKQQI